MMIPNIVHFIYLGGKPFSLVHYLAIKSACVVNNPTEVNFHYSQLPSGQWWEKAKPYVHLVKIETPTQVAGIPLCIREHQADVARLHILQASGGIYLDIDVICVKPFTPLLQHSFVLGEQGIDGEKGLCNAVILAEKGAFFTQKWLEGYDPSTSSWSGFRSNGYDLYRDEISIKYPMYLAKQFPEQICVQSYKKFHWPLYHPDHLNWFFRERGTSFDEAYCHHLWESLSWRPYLKDLTLDGLRSADTNFASVVSRFL